MILIAILSAYVITTVLVEGSIFAWARKEIRSVSWLTVGGTFILDCRLCAGFWVSLGVSLVLLPTVFNFFAIWGGSYFLATQER